jgi:hypothetical protein
VADLGTTAVIPNWAYPIYIMLNNLQRFIHHIIFFLGLSGFTISAQAQFNYSHALGLNFTAVTDGSSAYMPAAACLQYIPRFNKALGSMTSVSASVPFCIGIHPDILSGRAPLFLEIPMSFEFNLGNNANNYNRERLGMFAGAGLSRIVFQDYVNFNAYNICLGYRNLSLNGPLSAECRLTIGQGFGRFADHIKAGLSILIILKQ